METKERNNSKSIIIAGLLVAIVVMSIGYAALSSKLQINGTTQITSSWDVSIESITLASKSGTAAEVEAATHNGTSANFNVELKSPSDKITYNVVVKNNGSLPAYLHSISGLTDLPENVDSGIYFNAVSPTGPLTVNTDPALSTRLAPGESHTIVVVAGWTAADTIVPTLTKKELNLQLNYQQDTTAS